MGAGFRIAVDVGGSKIAAAAFDGDGGVGGAAWLWPPEGRS